MPAQSFYQVLTAAIADLAGHGYDTPGRLTHWMNELELACRRSLLPMPRMADMLRNALGAIYKRLVERGGVLARHPGIDRATLQRITPYLRQELDKRILAASDLIKLNKEEAVQRTLARFSGWATSLPIGGDERPGAREVAAHVRKSIARLPFEERRLIIDQTSKLTASINALVAEQGGAIAVIWNSHYRQAGYNYREEHRERDGKVYLLRESWARARGYVKPGEAGIYEDVTAFGEEIFCRCYGTYLYHLKQLPADMITRKGREVMLHASRANAA